MVIYHYPFNEKQNIPDCVLALGFFDGVHIAHRDLIVSAKAEADRLGVKLGIFTFASKSEIKIRAQRLYDDHEKAEIFASLGADFTVYADFSAISGASAEEFVKEMLVRDLSCKACVAGFNFRFSKGAGAGAKELTQLMSETGGRAIICNEIRGEGDVTLSATLIRGLIISGEIKKANKHLGAPYYIKGRVSHGRQVGRTIGFPTVNIAIGEDKILPRPGVYYTVVPIDGKIYRAVTNVGSCPTFGQRQVHLEAHIIDYQGDLYDRELQVFLLDFIREERTFASAEELIAQIKIDKNRVKNENGDITWQELGLN